MLTNDPYAALRSPHSNVWNVRAPYAKYLELHKQLNHDHGLRQITLDRMKTELRKHPLEQQVTETMLTSLYGRSHRIAVRRYNQHVQTIGDMLSNVERLYYESNKDTLQEISALFELYTVCWCCNMLLATLENRKFLSREQEALIIPIAANGTTPMPKKGPDGRYLGGIRQIFNAFPQFRRRLETIPRRKTNPQTRCPEAPVSDWARSALRIVTFWKNVRDQIAHQSGVVDDRFIQRCSEVWGVLKSDLYGIPPLQAGHPIPLRPAHVCASFTTHDLLAKGMRDVLIDYSGARRGHVFSPGPFRGAVDVKEMPKTLPQLFVDGDWNTRNDKAANQKLAAR